MKIFFYIVSFEKGYYIKKLLLFVSSRMGKSQFRKKVNNPDIICSLFAIRPLEQSPYPQVDISDVNLILELLYKKKILQKKYMDSTYMNTNILEILGFSHLSGYYIVDNIISDFVKVSLCLTDWDKEWDIVDVKIRIGDIFHELHEIEFYDFVMANEDGEKAQEEPLLAKVYNSVEQMYPSRFEHFFV